MRTTAENITNAASGPSQRHILLRSRGDGLAAVTGSDMLAGSSARQRLVPDAVRLRGVLALAPLEILDVLTVIALEPHGLRVALEGEDVSCDPVEEPAIVRDHHGAAGEGEQRFFQGAQRLDVEVVGWLIEQQHIASGAQHLGKVHAIALSAGELADQLLLLGTPEVETPDVAARGSLVGADTDDVEAARYLLPDCLAVIERMT